jgi:hypothetical protein
MPLIIEDGSGVANATCYGVDDAATTLDAARRFASDRGVVLSDDDAAITAYLLKAMDYIESREDEFVGERTDVDQSLSWPRKCVIKRDGSAFPDDEIPQSLLNALYQLCIEQFNGVALMPTTDNAGNGGFVIKEKVDVLETTYSEKIGTTRDPIMPAVEAWLKSIVSNASGFPLRTVRI